VGPGALAVQWAVANALIWHCFKSCAQLGSPSGRSSMLMCSAGPATAVNESWVVGKLVSNVLQTFDLRRRAIGGCDHAGDHLQPGYISYRPLLQRGSSCRRIAVTAHL
jgi:hypothetical protein